MHAFNLIWAMFSFRALLIMLLALASPVMAGERAADADEMGPELLEDTTGDADSRSGDIAAAAEDSPDPAPVARPAVPLADAVNAAVGPEESIEVLGTEVMPGTSQRLSWSATELFEGVPVSTPVLVVNGALPGPTLCLTAAVHGDELNGIEMVRRVMHNLEPSRVSGAVIGIPIVNVQGFRRGSRYLPDRRDLNRYFPGNPNGSAAARIAYSFFTNVIAQCDALIDLHTGSFERANLPQIRADLRNPDVMTLTQGFGSMVILHSTPAVGTLRYAATRAGIPAVTLEAGGPSQLELNEVKLGVKGIETLVNTLGMVRKMMNNARSELRSPYSGRIIGMARNQVVMPGFAAFHVGIQTDEAPYDDTAADAMSNSDDYVDGMSE